MRKIKIAQIGITHEHAEGKILSLEKLSDVYEIAGVVNDLDFSTTPRYINEVQECFRKHRFLTMDEVLNDPSIQAVTVEVPNNELVSVALKFAEKGIAMHMDKPAGTDPALFKQLLDICKERQVPFQMGFMFRGNPAFQFCLKAIREKWIGEVISIEADMNHGYGEEVYQQYIAKFSGGLMYNLGCHLIDFITAAMGKPQNVSGFLRSAPGDPDEIKNNCLAILEYPHAYAVVKTCSRQKNSVPARAMRITGTNGIISFSPVERFDGQPVVVDMVIKDDLGYPSGNHRITLPLQSDRYTEQLLELARIIRKEAQPAYSTEYDYLVHKITLAAAGYINWE